MSFIKFIQETGEKLLSGQSLTDVSSNSTSPMQGIIDYIGKMELGIKNLSLSFNPSTSVMTIKGEAPDQQTKEKVILCVGNVQGIGSVDDQISCPSSNNTAEQPSAENTISQYYQVKSGDNLSKIAKHFYDDANKFNVIFDANKPMLSSPDKIYPGQTLRIPKI